MEFAGRRWHKRAMHAPSWFVRASVLATSCGCLHAATFHVAPDGRDTGTGSPDQPFASLGRAREAIRELKARGPLSEPVSVLVRGGTYRLAATLTLGPESSGTAAAPVVWAAAPGAEVRLSGGITLAGDAFRPLGDPALRERLDPAARDHVLGADLRQLGVTVPGGFPDRFRGVPAAPELFYRDQRMTLARWPNEGWATIARIVDSGSVPREGETEDRPGTFEYHGDRPARWDARRGVWLQGYWCFDWYEETIRVRTIDVAQHRITFAKPSLYGVKAGNPSPRRYRALGLLEELDQPGEFHLDPDTGMLCFWPPGPTAGARVVLSTLDAPVVALQDAEHVTLRGFSLEAGLGNGIEVSGGRSNAVVACHVRNFREAGIRVTGGHGHRLEGCDVHDTGTGGLVLEGGDRRTLTPAGHVAVNNHVWQFSRHQFTSAYGLILGGVGNRAAHNLIHDAPHQAVALQGNDHVFEYNVVRHVVTETDDAGALYKGRNPSCRGNVIRYNLWRDIGSPMGHGTAAVYFDDGDGGDTVFGNVFLRCGHPGRGSFGTVFSHGGHDLRAENNLFIDCPRALGSAPWGDSLWQETLAGGHDCHWPRLLREEVDITRPPFTTRYPELVGFLTPEPGRPRVNRARNNVLVRCGEFSSGNWQSAPGERWATDTDPGFVAAARGDFRLRPDAEVFRRLPGFQPIPFERIGLLDHRAD
jgi:hypothetical protein